MSEAVTEPPQLAGASAFDAFEVHSLLSRIPSVHSMRDIPYVSSDPETSDPLAKPSPSLDLDGEQSSASSFATPPATTPEKPGQPESPTDHPDQDFGVAFRGPDSLANAPVPAATTAAAMNAAGMGRSFSTSSVISANIGDLSGHSSRLVNPKTLSLSSTKSVNITAGGASQLSVNTNGGTGFDTRSITSQAHTPQIASIADVRRLNLLRKRLVTDIAAAGPSSVNAIILSSVYERFNASFAQTLSYLTQPGNLDMASFLSIYHQIRDIHRQMQRMGPMGVVFPLALKLSEFIKWDYRQLVNSFLTLLRTSPGFVATAYLELSPRYAQFFIGKPGDSIDHITSAQRQCPLGIIYHGMFRDGKQRINFFAAFCTQLMLEANDDSVCKAVFAKLSQPTQHMSKSATVKLDRLLRRLLSEGQKFAAPVSAALNKSADATSGSVFGGIGQVGALEANTFWLKACRDLANILINDEELSDPDFALFVATLRTVEPSLARHIDSLAARHYRAVIRQLLTSPHRHGLLKDTYVGETAQRCILSPLVEHFSKFLKENPLASPLVDKVLGRHLEVRNAESYFEAGQHMVMSLSEIIFLYHSLFPSSALGAVASSASRSTLFKSERAYGQHMSRSNGTHNEEENEWCLENIQSDLEPVMKELAMRLPHLRGRLVRYQQPGLFADYWQVFQIEGDGLINNLDDTSWKPAADDLESVLSALTTEGDDIYAILNGALISAEHRGDHQAAFQIDRVLSIPSPGALQSVYHTLDVSTALLQSHLSELRTLLDLQTHKFYELREITDRVMAHLSTARLHLWYELEVRPSMVWQRSSEVVQLLRGEATLRRANSGSSVTSTLSRRYSTRNRRLSILSSHSLMDSFFVSRDYLQKPKLADRESEYTQKYFRHAHVRNFCRCEELIHRFNAEIYTLLHRILDSDFLISQTTAFKRDIRRDAGISHSNHRVSMSVLPDLRSQSRNHRKSSSSLMDIFEWKSAPEPPPSGEISLGIKSTDDGTHPDRELVCGLLLSDLGTEFLVKGSETDDYMQQTGRMVLDGDGQSLQAMLDDISYRNTPEDKLRGFEQLVKLVTARLSATLGVAPSRADISEELGRRLGRESGTLFRDLQVVAGLSPATMLEQGGLAQAFWDVAECAEKVLESVVTKSMDLALRMLRYQSETASASATVTNMAVSDSVAIWSFCARLGRRQAQRKLAQLYQGFPHTSLDVLPFSRPAVVFEGIDPPQARNAVVAHWMQLAAHQGDAEAQAWCQQQQNVAFI